MVSRLSRHFGSPQIWRSIVIPLILLLVVCGILLVGCGDSSSPSGVDLGSGSTLAFIGGDGNLWLSRADGQDAHTVTTTTCPPTTTCYNQPAWSPDGQMVALFGPVASGKGNTIYLYKRTGLFIKTIPPADYLAAGRLVWTSDGKYLMYIGHAPVTDPKAGSKNAINFVDVAAGKIANTVPLPPLDNGDVVCADNVNGGPIGSFLDRAIDGSNGVRLTIDIARDGQRILVSTGSCSTQIAIVDRASGKSTTLTPLKNGGYLEQGAFSPDGQHIVAVEDDNTSTSLVVLDGTGQNAKSIATYSEKPAANLPRVTAPTWSANSATIFFTRGADLWNINADGSNAHQVSAGVISDTQQTVLSSAQSSPDGKYLLWVALTYLTSDRSLRSTLVVADANGANPQNVAAGAIWAGWSR